MKIVKEEDVSTESLFNITKLIKNNYDMGTPLSKSFIDSLDMSEVSSKKFYILHNNTTFDYELKESLLINITRNLDLKYIKNFFDIKWIHLKGINEDSFISRSLYRGNLDLIEEFLLFSEPLLKDFSKEDKQVYFSNVLEPILRITYVLSYAKSSTSNINIDQYQDIFNFALSQYYKIWNDLHYYNPKPNMNLNTNFYDYFKNNNHYLFGNPEELINIILKTPIAFNFYKEIQKQYEGKQNNPFLNEESLIVAIKSFNLSVIKDLSNKMNTKKEFIKNNIISSVENFSQKTQQIFTVQTNHHYKKEDKSSIINDILDVIKEYISPNEIDKKVLSCLLINTNDDMNKKFNSLFPNFFDGEIIDGLTKEELIQSKKYFMEYIKENKIIICNPRDENQYPNYTLYFSNLLDELNPNQKIDLTEKQRSKIFSLIENEYLPLILKDKNKNISHENSDITFNNFKLKYVLEKNEAKGNSRKIKI